MRGILICLLLISSNNSFAFDTVKFQTRVEACFSKEVDLFEKTKGRLPTDDEADLIIDYCVNKKE